MKMSEIAGETPAPRFRIQQKFSAAASATNLQTHLCSAS
jgi:hypothetical protein